ncbi:MAG TPA: 4-hydroxyacetophenone monooxygenase, partial [Solirubrobacteraceae bacterium]|nr:4-hydroxyacetophenone monooxygenase [Solirubrobacteraceae bacterium]
RMFERVPAVQKLDRQLTFWFMELATAALTSRPALRRPFRAIARSQITRAIKDPDLLAKVMPSDEVGCKRIMLTDSWYPTLTQPNVELITDRVAEITPTGVRTGDGRERPADVLVLATGFESHAFVAPMEVVGASGLKLEQQWKGVPRAYLGMSVGGFPNMFLLYGPNTNGGAGSVIYTLEAGVNHVIAALAEMRRRRADRVEISSRVLESFDAELRAALRETVWHTGCTSWYVDENGNDPSQWPWLWSEYRRRTSEIEPSVYEFSAVTDRDLSANYT